MLSYYTLSPEVEHVYSLINVEEVQEIRGWTPKYENLPPITEMALPSSVKLPKLELKPLPSMLKYTYLGADDTFPVIISLSLNATQESQLLALLKHHSGAIGWTVADIKRITLLICIYHIYLEDDVKPSYKPQQQLNPNMKEVLWKEVLKLLDVGIYLPHC